MPLTRWLSAGGELIPGASLLCGTVGLELTPASQIQTPALAGSPALKGDTSAGSWCMVCSSCCEPLPVFSREMGACASAAFAPRVSQRSLSKSWHNKHHQPPPGIQKAFLFFSSDWEIETWGCVSWVQLWTAHSPVVNPHIAEPAQLHSQYQKQQKTFPRSPGWDPVHGI